MKVLRDEPLDRRTTFRIGGRAGMFIIPETAGELAAALRGHPDAFVLGGGSNLLVADGGIGEVISMERFDAVDVAETAGGALLTAGAGASLTAIARRAGRLALGGLEFAFGIPGTVGGAVVMNAGASGGEVKQSLVRATLIVNGEAEEFKAEALGLAYRHSALPPGAVVVSATFALKEGEGKEILERMRKGMAARRKSQPLEYPSAGSVFKNPPGDFAGRIIEACGLKGLREGDAQVSLKHANFIVNLGHATAAQVFSLIRAVEAGVWEKTGVRLERELKLAGGF
ncbi:MAG: UDP-N-acetylmuramate dehydrogenase [Nitrospinae bacterium]|nr:UDP-N-acetylmuramate dehydrogenase [Nitrospinota bacterium]